MRSGLLFLFGGVAAAGLIYLYQVVANLQLSPKEFAELNGWIADLAPLFILGGISQYYSNFHPARQATTKGVILIFNVVALLGAVLWIQSDVALGGAHSAVAVLLAVITGWMMGQLQFRLKLLTISTVSIVIGLSRLLYVLSWKAPDPLNQYATANLVSGLLGIWALSIQLWRESEPASRLEKKGLWKSALILSIASAAIPQFDMFLMNHTQGEADFISFTRASLIGRAVYALTVILAQWLLPQQIRGQNLKFRLSGWQSVLGVFAMCAIFALASPVIGTHLLHWDRVPDFNVIFFASAEISLLGVLFILIQTASSQHNLKIATGLLSLLALEGAIQLLGRFQLMDFLTVAVALQSVAILAAPVLGRTRT